MGTYSGHVLSLCPSRYAMRMCGIIRRYTLWRFSRCFHSQTYHVFRDLHELTTGPLVLFPPGDSALYRSRLRSMLCMENFNHNKSPCHFLLQIVYRLHQPLDFLLQSLLWRRVKSSDASWCRHCVCSYGSVFSLTLAALFLLGDLDSSHASVDVSYPSNF